MTDLASTARALMESGKGIFAADESNESADKKRLANHGIATGTEMRRKFRNLFLDAPGIEEYLTGVILYEETLGQKSDDGVSFPEVLRKKGIVPGIKVDQGLEPIPESPDEVITKGMLGLLERMEAFHAKYETGFTKWRAEIHIDGDRLPSAGAIVENAKRLATYACEAQRAGMVPMLEPEVLLSGKHSRNRARQVIEQAIGATIDACLEQCADPSAVIVKTSMAVSGSDTGRIDTPEEVAEDTLAALMASVPKEVPGIVFLSGGQSPDQATENLRAIAKLAKEKQAPWPLTFSFSRALQEEALVAWKGEEANVPLAREAFLSRLRKVSEASCA